MIYAIAIVLIAGLAATLILTVESAKPFVDKKQPQTHGETAMYQRRWRNSAQRNWSFGSCGRFAGNA